MSALILPDGVTHKVSLRARRISLRVDSVRGVIRLTTPRFFSSRKAQEFLKTHDHWIKKNLQTIPQEIIIAQNTPFTFFGQEHKFVKILNTHSKSTKISLENNLVTVTSYLDDPASRLTRFLKNESKQRFEDMARAKAANLNKHIKNIRINDAKTRWGSCSHDGNISFSWRLCFAPIEAIDYVVAHEVAHLVHLNHSKSFWALCENLCLDYKTGKDWMHENGYQLHRLHFSAL